MVTERAQQSIKVNTLELVEKHFGQFSDTLRKIASLRKQTRSSDLIKAGIRPTELQALLAPRSIQTSTTDTVQIALRERDLA